MLLTIQLILISLIVFSYFIHLLLMHRFIGKRTIINSFKTQFFTIMFLYFGIKWTEIAAPTLFEAAPMQAMNFLFDELYFALALALAILVSFNAFSAEVFSEFMEKYFKRGKS